MRHPFLSPFVNMYVKDMDYIRLLGHLKEYMREDIEFYTTEHDKSDFPVFLLGDVKLYMNHYTDKDEAIRKWNERKARLNWDNLFVMMFTESHRYSYQFDEMPYEKKICFVPFYSEKKSLVPVIPYIKQHRQQKHFFQVVNGCAYGHYVYYDALELLLTGKPSSIRIS